MLNFMQLTPGVLIPNLYSYAPMNVKQLGWGRLNNSGAFKACFKILCLNAHCMVFVDGQKSP